MAKHAAGQQMHASDDSARASYAIESDGRIASWFNEHPSAGGVLLAAICFAALALILYFVVFSDFSSSADFIYNQF